MIITIVGRPSGSGLGVSGVVAGALRVGGRALGCGLRAWVGGLQDMIVNEKRACTETPCRRFTGHQPEMKNGRDPVAKPIIVFLDSVHMIGALGFGCGRRGSGPGALGLGRWGWGRGALGSPLSRLPSLSSIRIHYRS